MIPLIISPLVFVTCFILFVFFTGWIIGIGSVLVIRRGRGKKGKHV